MHTAYVLQGFLSYTDADFISFSLTSGKSFGRQFILEGFESLHLVLDGCFFWSTACTASPEGILARCLMDVPIPLCAGILTG